MGHSNCWNPRRSLQFSSNLYADTLNRDVSARAETPSIVASSRSPRGGAAHDVAGAAGVDDWIALAVVGAAPGLADALARLALSVATGTGAGEDRTSTASVFVAVAGVHWEALALERTVASFALALVVRRASRGAPRVLARSNHAGATSVPVAHRVAASGGDVRLNCGDDVVPGSGLPHVLADGMFSKAFHTFLS